MQTLTTSRLTLRPWTTGDVDAVLDIYSRWDVMRYIGTTPQVITTLDEASARVERWQAADDGTHGVWAVVPREGDLVGLPAGGAPVGTILLKPIPASGTGDPLQPSGDTEIGWHFHPDVWGRGYATEAAAAVLAHAFERGLDRVVAVTHADNAASQAVCRRIGMTHRGTTDAYYGTTCELFDVTVVPGGDQGAEVSRP
ncbi:GNAT family N-acetyltransferase [Cellulosimicrobium cellulans]|uniref:GNAT family N-acetyltransferase n=1 Tax=Cellulosimicrobium cellulans TaxID=1710 RepID=UPI0024066E8D|nr:GNAT family N-acetyltransferase [Cellulosimicrobium cellulans]MDF9877095.1 RimJ/RimL family protein N-acetyltransferase [Cellulosimicrobium cellulans]